MAIKRASPRILQSVDRALTVLRVFDLTNPSLGITEISRLVKLNKATLYPILKTLEGQGFVEQDPQTSKYRLGPQVYHLGQIFFRNLPIQDVARPWAQHLADEFDDPVNVAVLSALRATTVIQILRDRPVQHVPTAVFAPFHSTAVGKVLLAFQPSDVRARLLERMRLPAYTPKTLTDKAALVAEAEAVRGRGFAVDDEETSLGLCCIAAPIRDARGTVIAALSLSSSTTRVTPDKLDEIAARVIYHADKVSSSLGYLPPGTASGCPATPELESRV